MIDKNIIKKWIIRYHELGWQSWPFTLTVNEKGKKVPDFGIDLGWKDQWSLEESIRRVDVIEANGVAILTGKKSDLFVVDVDTGKGGDDYIDHSAPKVSTFSGGVHYYYKYPEGKQKTTRSGILKGTDTRGDDGIIFAPPTPGYEWRTKDTFPFAPVTDAPTKILVRLDSNNKILKPCINDKGGGCSKRVSELTDRQREVLFNKVIKSSNARKGERSELDYNLIRWCQVCDLDKEEARHTCNVGKFSEREDYFDRTWEAALKHEDRIVSIDNIPVENKIQNKKETIKEEITDGIHEQEEKREEKKETPSIKKEEAPITQDKEKIESYQDCIKRLKENLRHMTADEREIEKHRFIETYKGQVTKTSADSLFKTLSKVSEKECALNILNKKSLLYTATHGFAQYNDGSWDFISNEKVNKLISDELGDEVTHGKMLSIRSIMSAECDISKVNDEDPYNDEEYRSRYINLKNGMIDIDTWELVEHDKKAHFTYKVNADYNIEDGCPNWIQFIKDISSNDSDKQKLLQEIFGYCLYPINLMDKIFLFIGNGSNGKSVYLRTIENIIGSRTISTVPISFMHEPFKASQLYGKLVNISTEEKSSSMKNVEILKQISSGDSIYAEKKGKDGFNFRPYCKIISAMNSMPMTRDFSHGFYRRLVMVMFNVTFGLDHSPPDHIKADPYIEDKFKKEYSGILNWAIEGLKRVIYSGKFTASAQQEAEFENYKIVSNPLAQFVKEEYIEKETGLSKKSQVYTHYKTWIEDNGYRPMAVNKFWENVKKIDWLNITEKRNPPPNNERMVVFKEKGNDTAVLSNGHMHN